MDLNRLVRQLHERGVKRVRGKVLGDGSLFDSRTGGPDSEFRTSIFIGPLSALSFNRGKARHAEAGYQPDPILATAEVFRAALEKRGIDVSGPAATGVAPKRAKRLAVIPSRRIEELVRRVVKWSDSFGAEVLLKDVAVRVTGRRGIDRRRGSRSEALRPQPRGPGGPAGRIGALPQEQGVSP